MLRFAQLARRAAAPVWVALALGAVTEVAAAETQSVLGPGLYVFQTRTRGSTCGDAEKDGYVLSYFAAIDGVPGATAMTMQLVNTQHFKDWQLAVQGESIRGVSRIDSGANAPISSFEVTREGDRFKGKGSRSYQAKIKGKVTACRVDYDALIKRLDS